MNKTIVIIPSLEPTIHLLTYIDSLLNYDFMNIVVINDGSSKKYDEIYKQIENKKRCTLLGYSNNMGKGYALKQGYQYVLKHFKEALHIITVDSDGQHAIQDVCKVNEALDNCSNDRCLVLGERNFSLPNIPIKSRIGNRLSSFMCLLLNGKWIQDTQTGLRGFKFNMLSEMIEIQGERFEYEMQVLNECISSKVDIINVYIETIYENNNESTHFDAVKDSVSIAKVLFSKFLKFLLSSVLSAVIDITIAFMLFEGLKTFVNNDLIRIALATIIARLISMSVNYTLNKCMVFKNSEKDNNYIIRYIILCIIVMVLSTLMVYVIHKLYSFNETSVKIVVDALLFIFSYKMQQGWVFQSRGRDYGK